MRNQTFVVIDKPLTRILLKKMEARWCQEQNKWEPFRSIEDSNEVKVSILTWRSKSCSALRCCDSVRVTLRPWTSNSRTWRLLFNSLFSFLIKSVETLDPKKSIK